jgi:phosphatidylglycerol lysyltransferase
VDRFRLSACQTRANRQLSTVNGLTSLLPPPSVARDESSRLEGLAFRHGATYDSYLTTEADRQVFWSGSGAGAVAYVRDGRYLHVAGGLLAPRNAKPQLLSELVRWADARRLVLVCYNMGDDDLPLLVDAGFQVTKWGEEAIVDLSGVTWSGRAYEWVRRQTNFCRRQGLEVYEYDWAKSPPADWQNVAAELMEISGIQMANKPQRHAMRFLEGHVALANLRRRRLFLARSDGGAGRIEGFLLCNPCLGGTRWAFETYRRRSDAIRGTMPHLMHQAMRQLQGEGVASVSLCLVPGLHCDRPLPNDSPLVRWSVVIGTRYFNFIHDTRGMYHYKSRFRPRFVNRYVAVRPHFSIGAACSFVRVLGVLDLHVGHVLRQTVQRLGRAASRRTLLTPETGGA